MYTFVNNLQKKKSIIFGAVELTMLPPLSVIGNKHRISYNISCKSSSMIFLHSAGANTRQTGRGGGHMHMMMVLHGKMLFQPGRMAHMRNVKQKKIKTFAVCSSPHLNRSYTKNPNDVNLCLFHSSFSLLCVLAPTEPHETTN